MLPTVDSQGRVVMTKYCVGIIDICTKVISLGSFPAIQRTANVPDTLQSIAKRLSLQPWVCFFTFA